jgi:hypothetical protein
VIGLQPPATGEQTGATSGFFVVGDFGPSMADLNPVAKRIHNVSPDPVRLTLSGGTSATYRMHSTEFFQRDFQGEGERLDDDAEYRLVSSEDNESVLLGRRGPDEDGWTVVGEVVAAERAPD